MLPPLFLQTRVVAGSVKDGTSSFLSSDTSGAQKADADVTSACAVDLGLCLAGHTYSGTLSVLNRGSAGMRCKPALAPALVEALRRLQGSDNEPLVSFSPSSAVVLSADARSGEPGRFDFSVTFKPSAGLMNSDAWRSALQPWIVPHDRSDADVVSTSFASLSLALPIRVTAPDQTLPVEGTLAAKVTPAHLAFEPASIAFGPCFPGVPVAVPVRIINTSGVLQQYAFTGLQAYPALEVAPATNGGIGYLLPGDAATADVVFQPPDATPLPGEALLPPTLTILSSTGAKYRLPVTSAAIAPPLLRLHSLLAHFPPLAPGESAIETVELENVSDKTVRYTLLMPQAQAFESDNDVTLVADNSGGGGDDVVLASSLAALLTEGQRSVGSPTFPVILHRLEFIALPSMGVLEPRQTVQLRVSLRRPPPAAAPPLFPFSDGDAKLASGAETAVPGIESGAAIIAADTAGQTSIESRETPVSHAASKADFISPQRWMLPIVGAVLENGIADAAAFSTTGKSVLALAPLPGSLDKRGRGRIDGLAILHVSTASAGAGVVIEPPSLDFGCIPVGTSSTLTATIEHKGLRPTAMDPHATFGVTSPSDSFFTCSSGPFVLQPGDKRQIDVTFAPAALASEPASSAANPVEAAPSSSGLRRKWVERLALSSSSAKQAAAAIELSGEAVVPVVRLEVTPPPAEVGGAASITGGNGGSDSCSSDGDGRAINFGPTLLQTSRTRTITVVNASGFSVSYSIETGTDDGISGNGSAPLCFSWSAPSGTLPPQSRTALTLTFRPERVCAGDAGNVSSATFCIRIPGLSTAAQKRLMITASGSCFDVPAFLTVLPATGGHASESGSSSSVVIDTSVAQRSPIALTFPPPSMPPAAASSAAAVTEATAAAGAGKKVAAAPSAVASGSKTSKSAPSKSDSLVATPAPAADTITPFSERTVVISCIAPEAAALAAVAATVATSSVTKQLTAAAAAAGATDGGGKGKAATSATAGAGGGPASTKAKAGAAAAGSGKNIEPSSCYEGAITYSITLDDNGSVSDGSTLFSLIGPTAGKVPAGTQLSVPIRFSKPAAASSHRGGVSASLFSADDDGTCSDIITAGYWATRIAIVTLNGIVLPPTPLIGGTSATSDEVSSTASSGLDDTTSHAGAAGTPFSRAVQLTLRGYACEQ